MSSIFTKIINGDIPAYKIAEDGDNIAFLDVSPVSKGHTLVVPKLEVDNLFDLPEHDYQKLMLFAKKVAHAIQKTIPCNRVGVTVIGLEVPHAHVHLVPISKLSDIDFGRDRLELSREEFESIAKKISDNYLP